MDRKAFFRFVVALLFVMTSSYYLVGICAGETRISDIMPDQEGQVVKLEGKVIDTKPKDQDFPDLEGTYTLKDKYGGSIKVWTMELPGSGEYIKIKGVISKDQDSNLLIRQRQFTWLEKYLVYAIIVAVVVVIALLIILIILNKRSKQSGIADIPVGMPPQEETRRPKAETTPAPAPEATTKLIEPRASVTTVDGASAGRTYEIIKPDILIGRDDGCDIQLPESDTSVSRRHARIKHGNRQYTIINESKTNPTRVNGKEIGTGILQDGDEIKVGTTKLQFKILSNE